MVTCLGVDPGLSTGLALYDHATHELLHSETVKINDLWNAGDFGAAAAAFTDALRSCVLIVGPDCICIEQPQASHKKADGQAIGQTREMPFAVMTWAAMVAHQMRLPCHILAVNTIRKAALGNGRLDKAAAHKALERIGIKAKNLHTRDATIAAIAGAGHHRVALFRAGITVLTVDRRT